jgi:hypothetical protein
MNEKCPECHGVVYDAPTGIGTYETICSNCGLVLSVLHGRESRPTSKWDYRNTGSGRRVPPHEYITYTKTPKECFECHKQFLPKRSWHRFCSYNCQMRSLMRHKRAT